MEYKNKAAINMTIYNNKKNRRDEQQRTMMANTSINSMYIYTHSIGTIIRRRIDGPPFVPDPMIVTFAKPSILEYA